MPGKPHLVAERVHIVRDDPEILGDDRQVAPRRAPSVIARRRSRPGAGTQEPCSAVSSSAGTSQHAANPRK